MPVMTVAIHSCGPAATKGGFDSANPAAKMYAIEQAAVAGDLGAVKDIIEQLDSDDPAVRLLAISALQRLTGETYGYRDYAPPLERRQAIARWVEAYRNGEIAGSPSYHKRNRETPSRDDSRSMRDHG